jgi:hypothetical protein
MRDALRRIGPQHLAQSRDLLERGCHLTHDHEFELPNALFGAPQRPDELDGIHRVREAFLDRCGKVERAGQQHGIGCHFSPREPALAGRAQVCLGFGPKAAHATHAPRRTGVAHRHDRRRAERVIQRAHASRRESLHLHELPDPGRLLAT